jgi:putative hemolysin
MMRLLLLYGPWLLVMTALVAAMALLAASEAALFYLRRPQRRVMAGGTPRERTAAALLADPERLLTAILFWNLLVNLAYFTLAAVIGLRLQQRGGATAAAGFAMAILLAAVVFGEMLPKSLALLRPRQWAVAVAVPLALLVRTVDPFVPVFRLLQLLTRRLLWPGFQAEPYLQTRDLERAVELSAGDAALLEREQDVLESVVHLSEIRADELMRPRVQLATFHPPVTLAALRAHPPASGYLLVTETDSEELASVAALRQLSELPDENLQRRAEPVLYVPWCARAAAVLELMRRHRRSAAAVVNELGETIGILTLDDIFQTIFSRAPSRSQRLLRRPSIRAVRPGLWHVTGMTSLRRLARYFEVPRPPSKTVTVAGVLQETLGHLPQAGEECRWGPFHLRVLKVPERGQLLVELTMPQAADDAEAGREEPPP